MNLSVRPIAEADTDACIDIYFDAIHNGTAPYYTAAQRAAWAPRDRAPDRAAWRARLSAGPGFLANEPEGACGFIVVTNEGYLDLFFVRPRSRGGGVAGALYNCALGAARERCLPRMTAHASRLLRPFLERRGWSLVAREQVDRNGIQIERFEMLLALDGD